MNEDRIIWVDVESTGLDVRCSLLEVAIVVTDARLEIIDSGEWLITPSPRALWEPTALEMHLQSGLLSILLARAAELSTAQHEPDMQRVVDEGVALIHRAKAYQAPMGGSSLRLDRNLIEAHLPQLDGCIHYRSIDVSTVKEEARRVLPAADFEAAQKRRPYAQQPHRAMSDVMESIEELRMWREVLYAW